MKVEYDFDTNCMTIDSREVAEFCNESTLNDIQLAVVAIENHDKLVSHLSACVDVYYNKFGGPGENVIKTVFSSADELLASIKK